MIFIEPIQSLAYRKNHQGVITMRRTAAVAMTAVTLGAGVGLTAVPASAAPAERKATKSWVTFDGKKGSIWRTIRGKGTYTRNGDQITVSGWLRDTKVNGWGPGVQFRVWRDGQWHVDRKYTYVKYVSSGKPVDKINYNLGKIWTGTGTHLQVREVAVKVSNKNKQKSGAWKKLF
ncbi:hypothetical protein GCM10009550_63730 [Actinocorallia libanotica]|uniref:Secreted protein n=2 Tax=Actinocorallia libanotica TaxID=46162 RepID=A0ABN1RV97_9ACTN